MQVKISKGKAWKCDLKWISRKRRTVGWRQMKWCSTNLFSPFIRAEGSPRLKWWTRQREWRKADQVERTGEREREIGVGRDARSACKRANQVCLYCFFFFFFLCMREREREREKVIDCVYPSDWRTICTRTRSAVLTDCGSGSRSGSRGRDDGMRAQTDWTGKEVQRRRRRRYRTWKNVKCRRSVCGAYVQRLYTLEQGEMRANKQLSTNVCNIQSIWN